MCIRDSLRRVGHRFPRHLRPKGPKPPPGDIHMSEFPFFRKNGKSPGARRTVDLFAVGKEDVLFHEKIKGLRAMVEQKADFHQMRLLGITSSIAGEEKTITCAQLGRSLASTGRKKVLLVD